MQPLETALSEPAAYPHPTAGIERIETHISWVFLAGPFAYKIKKPLDLGFLDFSTLERRKQCCLEEVRLNRRLCPDLYLDVVPITLQDGAFRLGGQGEVAEWAVRMRRFDRKLELDRLLAEGRFGEELVDKLSEVVARFHLGLPPLPPENPYGTAESVMRPVMANFEHMLPAAADAGATDLLKKLHDWAGTEHRRLLPLFRARKREGFIRRCHGDMHTGNMVLEKDRILIFDCIEFSERLSCIDVASDLAFLTMDLEHAGHPHYAWQLLNGWLSLTGDYGSLPLRRFYTLYRAMVRAKVTAIRYAQEAEGAQRRRTLEEHRSYLRLAERQTLPAHPLLLLMHGLSGSGKSTLASKLAPAIGAVHLRSDVERKRLAGLEPLEPSHGSIYSTEYTRRTYDRLLEITTLALEEGMRILVDATFLNHGERRRFITLAETLNAPWRIISCSASPAELEERLCRRQETRKDPSEADLAVLTRQRESREPLTSDEEAHAIGAAGVEFDQLAAMLGKL